jgi:membrane protein YdbS with pleckstrin-like domain
MRYADTLLANGEIIVLRSRQHWLALIAQARWALLAWLVTIGALIVIAAFGLEGTDGGTVLGWIALVALVVGLVLFFLHAWRWWAQDYIVTNRRIMKVEGVFNKNAADSSLEKINDAILRQGVIARMLGYGDLDILTAADSAIDRYRMLAGAAHFKVEMLNRKHALDLEIGGSTPAPPVRVDRPIQAPNPESTPAAPATGSGAVTDEAGDPEQITRTLAQLSDLRDRGAITAEEYEAKKRELLERL